MSDYYDHHPSLTLTRPLVVAGDLGCGARMIGRILCARTGLPFVELDREIEHTLGASLRHVAAEAGIGRIEHAAQVALERVSLRRPFPVIALDRAWPGSEAIHLVGRRVDLVHIQRPDAERRRRVRAALEKDDGWLALPASDPLDARVDAVCATREPLLLSATVLLQADGKPELVVANILHGAIDPGGSELAFELQAP